MAKYKTHAYDDGVAKAWRWEVWMDLGRGQSCEVVYGYGSTRTRALALAQEEVWQLTHCTSCHKEYDGPGQCPACHDAETTAPIYGVG